MQRLECFRVVSDFPFQYDGIELGKIYNDEYLRDFFLRCGLDDFDPRNYPLIFERVKEERFNSDDMIDFVKFSGGNPSNDLLLKWMESKDVKA